jgi:hypothetical protein
MLLTATARSGKKNLHFRSNIHDEAETRRSPERTISLHWVDARQLGHLGTITLSISNNTWQRSCAKVCVAPWKTVLAGTEMIVTRCNKLQGKL